jgi:hypothetical protein
MRFVVGSDYRGQALPRDHRVIVEASVVDGALSVSVDAPYFGDPEPAVPPGACDGLWEYEVVELFLADAGEHYLEIELGPSGHHFVLEMEGVRRAKRRGLPIEYQSSVSPFCKAWEEGGPIGRFYGTALVPLDYLPMPVVRGNAYAIHGVGEARVYCASAPTGGAVPDFHRLECFVPCAL